MATPRKHWFRVADSILREQLTVEQRGILVGLMAHLNQRWARDGLSGEEACRAVLSRAALAEITGRSQLAPARNALRALSQRISIAIRDDGAYTEIHWPNFAIFQRLESEPGAKQGQKSPPPQDAPARRKTQDAKKKSLRAVPAVSGWAIRCSRVLIDCLEPVPGATIPRNAESTWARDIEALGREAPELAALSEPEREERIELAIRWVTAPEQIENRFVPVVRSGSALRRKWSQVVAAAQRQAIERKPQDDFDAWMRGEVA